MAADVLAMLGARASAAMVLTKYDKWVIIFHKEGFNHLNGEHF